MGLVTEQPEGLASTNALTALPRPSEPAEVRLGNKTLCVLANPPSNGQTLDLMIKVRVTEDCVALHEDGSEVTYRKVKLLGAWRPGDPQPPAMLTADGKVDPSAAWENAPAEGTFSHEGQP